MPYDDKTIKLLLKNARYKGEIILNIVSVVLTLGIDALLIYACYNLQTNPKLAETVVDFTNINIDFIEFLGEFNSFAIIALLVIVGGLIVFYNLSYTVKAGFKNFAVDDLPDEKCVELFNRYCKLLEIKKPILYLNNITYESSVFGVKIRGNKSMGISSKAYHEIMTRQDYHTFDYQVAETLGSIYLHHYDLLFQLATFWARIIPIYSKAYSRALSYSTDRIAQILIGTDSLVTSIAREASGFTFIDDDLSKELLNPEVLEITPFQKTAGFLSGIRDVYPLPYFRLTKIYDNDLKDKEFIKSLNEQENS